MKVSIIGATAYTSRDLIKLLARHPQVEIVHLGGRREGHPAISEIFPELRGICDMPVTGMEPSDAPVRPDLAFFTLPHGVAHGCVPAFLAAGVRCIDFSADYRFDDLKVYEEWYGKHGDPGNVGAAVYGLPELTRSRVAEADLVANPGCYPTSVALGLAPLAADGLIEPSDIIVDSKSGVSGRGNKPDRGSMYCECNEDVRAYNVSGHRHEPEMVRALELAGARGAAVTFTPHLVPMDRGILSTIVVRLTRPAGTADLFQVMSDFYAGEPFVRVLSGEEQPRTKAVAFTNYCDVAAVARQGGRAVVTAAIDNLMKGASSQAVQNMNVMFGLEETMGLRA
ncbi:MAG: N-acetyl-gamma-glutamyl-phosphate reductase [Planctomycetes bacterium]|nr:N-acetyl-gamma-glutamyl-phosphate reductase [Planctomycetota bacterium]